MKFLLTLFSILLITVFVAHLALNEPGYVLLSYGKTGIELPLIDFLVLTLLTFCFIYLLIRLISRLTTAPDDFKKLRDKQQASKSRKNLLQGLIDMAQGNWSKAEQSLMESVQKSELPVLNYLAAAHAAQRQDALEKRDDYLRMASKADPKAAVAIGLAQAELQIRKSQHEEALATLKHLEQLAPKHRFVKKLLARLFRKLQDWESLNELLPSLRKLQSLPKEELEQLETDTIVALMQKSSNIENTQQLWQKLSRSQQENPDLINPYAQALIHSNQSEKAEEILRTALNNQWNDQLIETYGELKTENPQTSLQHITQWLSQNSKSPQLLTAAGRLSIQAKLWGKARSLLHESNHIQPSASNYQALAQLHEYLNEAGAAKQAYRQGFELLNNQRKELRSGSLTE